MLQDHHRASITPAERVMLDYAVALTLHPQAMGQADVEALRSAGFDDDAISQIVQVTALFNYYNRVVDGIGTEDEPP